MLEEEEDARLVLGAEDCGEFMDFTLASAVSRHTYQVGAGVGEAGDPQISPDPLFSVPCVFPSPPYLSCM